VSLAESTVALRRHDGGVPENLLQGRERSSSFEPSTRERVPQLVRVEVRAGQVVAPPAVVDVEISGAG
jgi:hypothetical protein